MVRRSPRLLDARDRLLAYEARRAGAPVDPHRRARQRRTGAARAALLGVELHERPRAPEERPELLVVQIAHALPRIDALDEEHLRFVDVADAGDDALEHEGFADFTRAVCVE